MDFLDRDASSIAFRAQLAIPEQRELFDYWLEIAGDRTMPCRADMRPTHFPKLLPAISLMDVVDLENLRLRVRLAGTRIREIYDREVTGLYLEEFDLGGEPEYWQAAYRHVLQTAKPAQGVLRSPRMNKDHLVQFWLRLPLACEDGRVGMVLCHDMLVAAGDVPRTMQASEEFPPISARRA